MVIIIFCLFEECPRSGVKNGRAREFLLELIHRSLCGEFVFGLFFCVDVFTFFNGVLFRST